MAGPASHGFNAIMLITLAKDLKSTPLPVADDPRWARVVARDKSADGQFWYSVATTGVYCRPSCPSRRASPANVQLHDTLAQAKATGFRACRRCNPDGPSLEAGNAAMVADACRRIEQSEEEPSLAELADAAGRSAGYFHGVFKAITGLTPKDYARQTAPPGSARVSKTAPASQWRSTMPASIRAGVSTRNRPACSA